MKKFLLIFVPAVLAAQFHRAEQDREIHYWLLEPDSHQFRLAHDFTASTLGQTHVHSDIRKGSVVTKFVVIDLNTGKQLQAGIYPTHTNPEPSVVDATLDHPLAEGETVRVRFIETYTDPVGYRMEGDELVWDRTLGRPYNDVALPAGWMLTSVSVPAIVSLDTEGRVVCRFTNPRNDEIHVVLKARQRKAN